MWARLASVVRAAFGRRRFEAELDEELRFHVERYAQDLERGGMSAEAAARQAQRELGAVPSVKRDCRQPLGLVILDRLSFDFRQALRTLRAGTSWMAAVMLALAIGLTTATFSIVDALFLRPVPFEDAERLAYLNIGTRNGYTSPSWAVWRAWKDSGIFAAVGGTLGWWTVVIRTEEGVTVRPSSDVTPGTLEAVGVRPLRGRTFTEDDARAGEAIVIAEDLWTTAFGRDERAIGRSIEVDGKRVVVIGILPRTFRFPGWDTEVWRPIARGAVGPGVFNQPDAIVRFRRDVPRDETLRLATAIAHQVDASTADQGAVPTKLAGWPGVTNEERAMPVIAFGVGLVFVALSVNVAGLLLSRFNERRREFALAAALGASRGRLVMQAFAQSAVLCAVGVVLGIVLARQLIAGARALLPQTFLELSLHPLLVDGDTLAIAAALAVVAVLVCGLLPAVVATRLDAGSSLRLVERTGTESRAARALSRGFVIVELALACALLVPTLLLIRSFVNLTAIDRGLDPRGLTIVQVNFDNRLAPDPPGRAVVQARTTELLSALPGVRNVTWSAGVPTMSSGAHSGYYWRPDPPGVSRSRQVAAGMPVSDDFFDVYRIPIVRGRALGADDDGRRVVIDEQMAATFWPDGNPVGQRLAFGDQRLEIVGVARKVQAQRPGYPPAVYWKFNTLELPYAAITLKCASDCPSEAVIRHGLLPIEPALRAGSVDRLEDKLDRDLAAPRMTAALATVFGTIALVAAAGGLFSTLSYAVSRRRREFGIRAALGGSARAIGALVLRDAAMTAVIGVSVGSLAAWFLARALEAIQYGVTISDPISWMVVVGILAVASLAAVWRPMQSAMRADPARLLREE